MALDVILNRGRQDLSRCDRLAQVACETPGDTRNAVDGCALGLLEPLCSLSIGRLSAIGHNVDLGMPSGGLPESSWVRLAA